MARGVSRIAELLVRDLLRREWTDVPAIRYDEARPATADELNAAAARAAAQRRLAHRHRGFIADIPDDYIGPRRKRRRQPKEKYRGDPELGRNIFVADSGDTYDRAPRAPRRPRNAQFGYADLFRTRGYLPRLGAIALYANPHQITPAAVAGTALGVALGAPMLAYATSQQVREDVEYARQAAMLSALRQQLADYQRGQPIAPRDDARLTLSAPPYTYEPHQIGVEENYDTHQRLSNAYEPPVP